MSTVLSVDHCDKRHSVVVEQYHARKGWTTYQSTQTDDKPSTGYIDDHVHTFMEGIIRGKEISSWQISV